METKDALKALDQISETKVKVSEAIRSDRPLHNKETFEPTPGHFIDSLEMLKKILIQAQMSLLAFRISDDSDNAQETKDMINKAICFYEEVWEKYYQESKRNNVLELMILKQNKKIKDLMSEVEFYKT